MGFEVSGFKCNLEHQTICRCFVCYKYSMMFVLFAHQMSNLWLVVSFLSKFLIKIGDKNGDKFVAKEKLTFLASDIAKVTSSSTTAFWFMSCGWIKIVFATDLEIYLFKISTSSLAEVYFRSTSGNVNVSYLWCIEKCCLSFSFSFFFSLSSNLFPGSFDGFFFSIT